MPEKLNRLYNWLFHYNPHKEQWNAFHREDANAYWNNSEKIHPVYTSPEFHKLIQILYTTDLCT